MKIKNKYSKNRSTKEERLFNVYMNTKKKLRIKLQKIIPLNEYEKTLYKDNENHKDRSTKPQKGKYFGLNGETILLSAIPKTNLTELYNGLKKMLKKHSFKNLGPTIFEEELKTSIYQFSNISNDSRYIPNIYLTPKAKSLEGLVDFLILDLFDLSNDYIGISISIKLTKEIKKEINDIMKNDYTDNTKFRRYYSKNKTRVTKTTWNPDIPRSTLVDDYMIEIKTRVYQFVNKYIKLSPTNNYKAPISLDIYCTNYDLSDDKIDAFLRAYDIYPKYCRHGKMSVIYRDGKAKEGDDFVESDFCFNCSESSIEINRAGRLVIYKEDENQQMFMISSDLINLFIIVLYFYYLGDFQRALTSMRDALYIKYDKGDSIIYRTYGKHSKIMAQYKMMFNNVRWSEHCHNDDKIKSKKVANLFPFWTLNYSEPALWRCLGGWRRRGK
jgi:hypothetical protein